jgi:adenylate cyclase
MDPEVRDRLLALGASEEEIDRAGREGWLPVLAVEHLLFPTAGRFSTEEIDQLSGVDPELTDRMWRALGFPDSLPDSRDFNDADLGALKRALDQYSGDNIDVLVQHTRVVSAAMARVAESWTDLLVRRLMPLDLDAEETTSLLLDTLDFDEYLELYGHVLRRQILAAVRRRFRTAGEHEDAVPLTVGFVDLVAFTSLALQIGPSELAALVGRFEALAFDTVADHGGRVVKTIGDEVMFVNERVEAAAETALTLAETHARAEDLPDVRVGLACGDLLPFEGDYYGPTVNLASRVVSVARRGTIVVADDAGDALTSDPRFELVEIPARRLKDIGPVRLWALRRGSSKT